MQIGTAAAADTGEDEEQAWPAVETPGTVPLPPNFTLPHIIDRPAEQVCQPHGCYTDGCLRPYHTPGAVVSLFPYPSMCCMSCLYGIWGAVPGGSLMGEAYNLERTTLERHHYVP